MNDGFSLEDSEARYVSDDVEGFDDAESAGHDEWDSDGSSLESWADDDEDVESEDWDGADSDSEDSEDDAIDLDETDDSYDEDDDFDDEGAEGEFEGNEADRNDGETSMWEPTEFAAATQQQQVAMYAAQQADLMAAEFAQHHGYEASDEARFAWMKQAEDQAWNFVHTEQSRRSQFRANMPQHRSQFRQFGLPENAADELAHIVEECGTGVMEDPYLKMLAIELAVGRAVVQARHRNQGRPARSGKSMEMPNGLGEVRFSKAQAELIESVRKTVYGGRRLSLEEKRRIAGYE